MTRSCIAFLLLMTSFVSAQATQTLTLPATAEERVNMDDDDQGKNTSSTLLVGDGTPNNVFKTVWEFSLTELPEPSQVEQVFLRFRPEDRLGAPYDMNLIGLDDPGASGIQAEDGHAPGQVLQPVPEDSLAEDQDAVLDITTFVKDVLQSGVDRLKLRLQVADPNDVSDMDGEPDAFRLHGGAGALVALVKQEIPDKLGRVSKPGNFHALRLNNDEPIIDQAMFSDVGVSSEGRNINGPSLIRLPDWLAAGDRADPSAVYYLYFANHGGDYIRMAWAADLEGPWHLYQTGSAIPDGERGVLDLGPDDQILPGNGVEVRDHIASPDMFVDDANQQIIMYFHAPSRGGQKSFVATSADGLNFHPPDDGGQPGHGVRPVMLGRPYFRVFEYDEEIYAQVVRGDIFKAPEDPWTPSAGYDYTDDYWTAGGNPFEDDLEATGQSDLKLRHYGLHKVGDILYLFYTRIGDRPERIVLSTLDLSANDGDWLQWDTSFPPREILRPAEEWEGVNHPIEPSQGSGGTGVHQLRDPGIFEDADGRLYLLYTGAGEEAIGLARLLRNPEVTGDTLMLQTGRSYDFGIQTEGDVEVQTLRIHHTTPLNAGYDAEDGSPDFAYTGSGGYDLKQAGVVIAGSKSFHLAHTASEQSEILEIPHRLYGAPGAAITVKSRLTEASAGQVAAIQVSTDDGETWRDFWLRVGRGVGDPGDAAAEVLLLSLKDFEGQLFQLRFHYFHDPTRQSDHVTGADPGKGWYLDDIALTGVEKAEIEEERGLSPEQEQYSFTPPREGRFVFTVRGLFQDAPTRFGPPFVVRAFDDVPQAKVLESEIVDETYCFQLHLDPRLSPDFQVKGADSLGKPMTEITADIEETAENSYHVTISREGEQMFYRAATSPLVPAQE